MLHIPVWYVHIPVYISYVNHNYLITSISDASRELPRKKKNLHHKKSKSKGTPLPPGFSDDENRDFYIQVSSGAWVGKSVLSNRL